MNIKQHPEWTEKYPAIDGIPKGLDTQLARNIARVFGEELAKKKPIRSDIEEILKLGDKEFYNWYTQRKQVTEKLLQDYQLFSTIPDLSYSTERQKVDMTIHVDVKNHLEYLKKGLEYLLIIKTIREEIKGCYTIF